MKTSPAERMRRHREVFTYALKHGLTLLEAEAAIARERWLAVQAAIAAKHRTATAPTGPAADRWMLRD